MFNSIKSKLIIWFLFIFSMLFFGLGVFLYYKLKDIAIASIDSHLHSETQLLTGFLEIEKEQVEWELKQAAVGDYTLPFSGHYYQIVSSRGDVIAKSPSLADKSLPFADEKTDTASYKIISGPKGEAVRLMNQPVKILNRVLIIQAAESLEDAYGLLRSFRNIIIIVFPIVFIVSGIGILTITNLSLKIVNVFSRRISSITEKNLNERIEEKGIDKELLPLAESFNNMLRRIGDAFVKQKRFLSDASHELRTPTSVIKSYCDVTLKKEREKKEYEDALNVIRDTAEKMILLIQKILDAARLEARDALLLKKETVDIGSILNAVYKLMLPIADEKGIKILAVGGAKGINISGDKERLTELFINLVDNAIKYNRKNGRVILSSDVKNGAVIVTISDTGIGIPEEDLSKIFDRFYRVDKSRSEVNGAGLGLSIAKAIVEAHNGSIEAASTVGKGSTFKIALPLA